MLTLNKGCCLVALLFFLTTICGAQETTPPLSLKQLIDRVDHNAPALIADSSAIQVRVAEAAETHSNWLPNLKLNYQADVGTNNNVAGPYFGFGIIPSDSRGVRPYSNTTAASANVAVAALDWEIYNFGAYGAANRLAQSNISVEQKNFAQSKYSLEAFTINRYLVLASLEDYLNIQTRNIKRTQEILRSVSALTRSGVRPGVDTSIANAELSRARLTYIELNNQVRQIQLQLSTVTGLPSVSIIADTMVANRLMSAPPNNFQVDTSGHPIISYYQSLVQNSKARENLVKKEYNPKILLEGAAWGRGSSLDANDHFNNLSTGWGFQRDNYLVGLGVTYNLFDLRRRQLKLNTRRTETDYYRNKLDEQKALLAGSAEQAAAEMSTARERLREIPNQLRAATQGYRQKLSLYRNGLTDIIELDAALSILYRAETDYAAARFDYTSALFNQAITDNQVKAILNILK